MSTLSEFWKQKHNELTGHYGELCSYLAIQIGVLLLREGRRPALLHICGLPVDNPFILATRPLRPLPYPDLEWSTHMVCAAEGLVYDPIFGEPEPIETYTDKLFGEPVQVTPWSWEGIDTNAIEIP